MAERAKYDLRLGDCREILPTISSSSVHMILTDPPYFLDGLDDKWSKGKTVKATGSVGGLPVGMKFDIKQGCNLQKFMEPVFVELFRVLKPGGFMLVFSAPRLYHRMAVAAEECGFEIRDQYVWHFHGKSQFKAFSMDHIVRKRKDIREETKIEILESLGGRKTPQLRPQFESILCARKPHVHGFVENWMVYETGLIDAKETLTGKSPTTVMFVEKEKNKIGHLTPKPLRLCEHLIKLFSTENQIVLDPFLGSGTTCFAANNVKRRSIGIEKSEEYLKISRSRFNVLQ